MSRSIKLHDIYTTPGQDKQVERYVYGEKRPKIPAYITFESWTEEMGKHEVTVHWSRAMPLVRKHHGTLRPVRVIWRHVDKCYDDSFSAGWSWIQSQQYGLDRHALYTITQAGNPLLSEIEKDIH